jgi:ribonuclease HIII
MAVTSDHVAAGSTRWVVLVSAALIRKKRIKAIHTTGKKDSKNQSIQDLRAL